VVTSWNGGINFTIITATAAHSRTGLLVRITLRTLIHPFVPCSLASFFLRSLGALSSVPVTRLTRILVYGDWWNWLPTKFAFGTCSELVVMFFSFFVWRLDVAQVGTVFPELAGRVEGMRRHGGVSPGRSLWGGVKGQTKELRWWCVCRGRRVDW